MQWKGKSPTSKVLKAWRAADCTFADFDGKTVARFDTGSTSSLRNCTFADNTLHRSVGGTAVVLAYSDDATARDTRVRLQGCTFTGNTPEATPVLHADSRGPPAQAVIYSDAASAGGGMCGPAEQAGDGSATQCDTIQGLDAVEEGDFLSANDCWLVAIQKVCVLPSPCSCRCFSLKFLVSGANAWQRLFELKETSRPLLW
jgi:hypothetical protein